MRELFSKIIFYILQPIVKIIFSLFFRLEIESGENLKKLQGPLIIASNHSSWTDPFLIISAFPIFSKVFPVHYGCGWRSYHFPLFWPWLFSIGSFPVKQGMDLNISLKFPLDVLKNNGVVGIFPEGRRTRDGNFSRGKRGAAFLAEKTDTPIFPVKITGNVLMSFWKALFFGYKAKVKFGRKFFLPEKKIEKIEDYNELADFIMEKIKEI